jgi:hypothetical protein
MNNDFTRSLEKVLRGAGRRETPPRETATAKPQAADPIEVRHQKWFAQYADEHVLPLLTHSVAALKRRGFVATCQLLKDGENVTAELVITPPGLPPHAKPPRFTVSAAQGPRGLAIDYTGTFPHPGTEAGFGSEVVYDTVYTSELEEQLLEFVKMAAVGA